ncbi:MAG: cbb3-type cytochrome c oxidase subunit I [Acidobacteria bacterium]|nr:cbb3-type cytochrome c oxidase subunit I [Acidobacteriota bacterium]
MTTFDTHVAAPAAASSSGAGALGAFVVGIGSWATTTDHKKIGRLFIGTALVLAAAAAVVGAFLGFERISASGYSILDLDSIEQLNALYRVVLAFGVALPLMLGVAIAIVPLQIGSKAISFGRVALFGFWMWFAGLGVIVYSIAANGGPGGGNAKMVDLFLIGVVVTAAGGLAATVSLVTTVLTSRAPGMDLSRVPMLSWASLTGGVALLLTLPVVIGTTIYLYVDHHYGRLAFGANKGINDWLGWSLTQPQTYVFGAIGVGVVAEIATVAGGRRHPLRAVLLVGAGVLTVAALGGATQVQHSITWTDSSGSDKVKELIPFLIFNGLPLLGALIVLAGSAFALAQGKPRILAPLVPAFLGLGMMLAGMAGHLVGQFGPAGLAGTVFEEGEFNYVVYGTLLIGIGAVAYWGPKLWGRSLPQSAVFGLGTLGFLGTVLASLPLYVAGFADQPAGVVDGFTYGGPQELWNALAAIGHALIALTVILFILTALRAFRSGEAAGDDPWDAQTLEWSVSSPAPADNFASVPVVASAEPLLDLKPAGSEK